MTRTAAPAARAAAAGLLLAGVLLTALTMRSPLVAPAPVADDLRADLAMTAGTFGLLTAIPVLCFGLAAPLASALIARTGPHRAVLVTLAGVLAGTVVRSVGDTRTAIAGTVLIGLAITVGNVVLPVVIGTDFPDRAGSVTAAYTSALNVGSALATTATAPLADVVGWRWALTTWGLLVVLAAVVWVAAMRRARAHGVPAAAAAPSPTDAPGRPVWRQPAVWGLTLAFGGQAFSYYGVTAWLPTLLADERGLDRSVAGVAAALFQVFAVAGAFAVPALVRWWRRPGAVMLAVTAAWAVLPVGLLLAPGAWTVWCSVAGIAQGGGFTAVFTAVIARSRTQAETRRTSAAVQGGGYVLAAVGPLLVGAAHDASGGWTLPMLLVLAAIGVMAAAGAPAAGFARTVPQEPTSREQRDG